MQPFDHFNAWLSSGGYHRKPEYFEMGQARDQRGLVKLAELLGKPARKGVNLADETEIWDFWQALPLQEADDLPRAQALYYQVVERGGSGSNLVQEGLLGLICATENPGSVPFWLDLLDLKPAQRRDNFRRQRQSYALAALARLAARRDEGSAFEALIQAAHHAEGEVREQAVDYLDRCYRVKEQPLPAGLLELLARMAGRDEAFPCRFQARMILHRAGWPVPQDPAATIYGFIIQLEEDRRVRRVIELLAEQTLADLQVAIQQALGWDNDHAYTFFMSGADDDPRFALHSPDFETWDYEADEDWPTADEITLAELGLSLGHTFLYLFDYGDQHRFTLQLGAVTTLPPEKVQAQTYPRLVESRGEAPPQYPEWDDDEF